MGTIATSYILIRKSGFVFTAGGTFAMYSLLCRHINIGILPSKKLNSIDDRSHNHEPGKLGKFLERSIIARRILLFVAVLGMCMLIGDGILTPAISGFHCSFNLMLLMLIQ